MNEDAYVIRITKRDVLAVCLERFDGSVTGSICKATFLTENSLVTLSRPNLVSTHTQNNVATMLFRCEIPDYPDRPIDVTLSIVGREASLIEVIDYLVKHLTNRHAPSSKVKHEKNFYFEPIDDLLQFEDESLASLFDR